MHFIATLNSAGISLMSAEEAQHTTLLYPYTAGLSGH